MLTRISEDRRRSRSSIGRWQRPIRSSSRIRRSCGYRTMLTGTENRIAVSRRGHNQSVEAYNAYILHVPAGLDAVRHWRQTARLLQNATSEAHRAAGEPTPSSPRARRRRGELEKRLASPRNTNLEARPGCTLAGLEVCTFSVQLSAPRSVVPRRASVVLGPGPLPLGLTCFSRKAQSPGSAPHVCKII